MQRFRVATALAVLAAVVLLAACAGVPLPPPSPGVPAAGRDSGTVPVLASAAGEVAAPGVLLPVPAAAPEVVAPTVPVLVVSGPAPEAPVGPVPVEMPATALTQPAREAIVPEAPVAMDPAPIQPVASLVLRPAEEEPQPQPGPAIPIPDRSEVREVVEEFLGPGRRSFVTALERSGNYLPMIVAVFAEAGLPTELAYLAMVESHFLADARSHADAVGLWQFIDSTGRNSGLRVDWWVDERLDPEAATRAAARHLAELHGSFGDWELALAAYNAGGNGIQRLLNATSAQSFWELSSSGRLRAETRRYVPKFYATLAIAADLDGHGLTVQPQAREEAGESVWVESPVALGTVASLLRLPRATLAQLNPALLRGCTPPGAQPYPLRVPAGRAAEANALLRAVPADERLDFERHVVRSGDSLWKIATRYGTRVQAIAELNRITDPRSLRPGQALVVPVSQSSASALKIGPAGVDQKAGRRVHEVRTGDTLWELARRYGTGVAELIAWNSLRPGSILRPGDRLVVSPADGPSLSGGVVHRVETGETLWRIAKLYGVPLEELLRRNSLRADAVLHPGDEIVIAANGPT